MRKLFFVLLLFIGIIFWNNCGQKNTASNQLLCKVSRQNFVNKITVFGELMAQKNIPINTPEIYPYPIISFIVPEGTFVKKDEIVCQLKSGQIETDYADAQTELENARADYNKTVADLNLQRIVLESQVKDVEAATNIARLKKSRLAYVSDIQKQRIELEIEMAELRMTKLRTKLKSLESIRKSRLISMEMQIKKAENKMNRAKMFLDRLTLRSTVEGMVVYQRSWMTGEKVKEGDTVYGGMPILMIPEISKMQVKLNVGEMYIKRIEKEQRAIVRVDALPDTTLSGKVTQVSSVGKPIKRGSKIKNYEVYVALDSNALNLQPGLSSSCEIIINEAADTLAIPLICVFENDSSNLVYVKEDDKFRAQPVKLGKRGENMVVIADGLQGGEVLALTEPPKGLIKKMAGIREKTKGDITVPVAKDSINDSLQVIADTLVVTNSRKIAKEKDEKF